MCKLEEYGNCDEETREQEYCIFHKPDKNEIEAREFYKKFLERFRHRSEKVKIEESLGEKVIIRFVFEKDVNCAGYHFPEIPKDSNFSFEYAVFKGNAWFGGVTFKGNASFKGTVFEKYAEFDEATFEKNVNFGGAIFNNRAWFRCATFKGSANFWKSIFKHRALFSKVTFEEDVIFDATFEGYADFEGTTFKKRALFDETTFEGDAKFTEATFEGDLTFNNATFKRKTYFNSAEFKRNASFSETTFKGYTSFFGATFKGKTQFRAIFEGFAVFGNSTFEEDVSFDGTIFQHLAIFIGRFYGRLNLSNTEFRRGVNIVVISEWFKLPEAEAEACRIKRISYEREGKKDDADRMFVRERRALRRAKIWQAKEQLGKLSGIKSKLKAIFELLKVWLISGFEYVIADFTCHYGTNWKRPVFLWLFTVLIFVPFVYSCLNGCLHLNVVKGDSIEVKSLLDYIYFSIVTATTLGYGDFHPVGIGKAIASLEAIFGTFMWAVFLVVFSRKFMR